MQFDQNKYISIHSEGNKKNNQQPINKYGMHVGVINITAVDLQIWE